MDTTWQQTPLYKAAVNGQAAAVAAMRCLTAMAGNSGFRDALLACDDMGWTALHVAARLDFVACVRLLVNGGARLDAINHEQRTPLHFAATAGSAKCAAELLECGASARMKDSKGQTPLHDAAMMGEVACIRALVAAGANIQAADDKQRAPLDLAMERGHERAVDVLLELALSRTNIDGSRGEHPCHMPSG